MFGIGVEGHPNLRRILMPPWWEGHPLRKEHPAAGHRDGPLPDVRPSRRWTWQEDLAFRPEEWGLEERADDPDVMFLNVGPQHRGTHGVVRITRRPARRGDRRLRARHRLPPPRRRRRWASARPGTPTSRTPTGSTTSAACMNNLAYLLSVEQLAGIEVPDRAQVIRVMLCELFRITSHLVCYGTFAQDIGALSPVFYMFTDRERHPRHHRGHLRRPHAPQLVPHRRRGRGPAGGLGRRWSASSSTTCRPRLREYDQLVIEQPHHAGRARRGVGAFTLDEAIEWGVTGPNLRACGLEWDYRKKRPYSGYEQFDFEIPTATRGDCYDRAAGARRGDAPEPAHHPAVPRQHAGRALQVATTRWPRRRVKEPGTMHDIETLINHFLGVSWGPVIPPGEAVRADRVDARAPPATTCISDGGTSSYRTRIRTPSFPHLQMLPLLCRGLEVAGPDRHPGQHRLRAWPTWTGERREDVLTDEERARAGRGACTHYPSRRAAAITALKIVQRHRRWVSDEALADVGEFLGVSTDELDSAGHLLQPALPPAGGPARDPGVRQHGLLVAGLRAARASASRSALGVEAGRDHRRRPLHAAADRLPRRLRAGAGHAGRRRPARPARARTTVDAVSWSAYRMSDVRRDPLTGAFRADGRPLAPRRVRRGRRLRGAAQGARRHEPRRRHRGDDGRRRARTRRRRLPRGPQVELHAPRARRRRPSSTSPATPTRWSPAASRTASSWRATRTCCSRACCSPATRPRRRPATSSCAASTRASPGSSTRALDEARAAGYLGDDILGSRLRLRDLHCT